MITQRRQTYACHVDIDSFMVLYVYFDPKILKSSLQCNLKEAMFSPLMLQDFTEFTEGHQY